MVLSKTKKDNNDGFFKEAALPFILFVAGATIWFRPERSLSVLLLMVALFVSPLAPSIGPFMHRIRASIPNKNIALEISVSTGLSCLTEVVNEISKNEMYLDRLMTASTNLVRKATANGRFKSICKEFVLEFLHDKEIQEELVLIIKDVLVIVSKEEGLKKELLTLIQEEVLDMFNDSVFMVKIMEKFCACAVYTLEIENLNDAILNVVKASILNTLEDDEFTQAIISFLSSAAFEVTKETHVGNALVQAKKHVKSARKGAQSRLRSFRDS